MKKILFIFYAALFSLAAIAQDPTEETDFVSIEDIVINPGEEVEIGVSLTNEKRYIGFQCNIALPEGLEFAFMDEEFGDYIETVYNRCRYMNITACGIATQEGPLYGSLAVVLNAQNNRYILLNEGEVFKFKVKATDGVHVSSEIIVKNVVLSEVGYISHYFADATGNVTMPGTLADYIEDGIEGKPCVISESLTCVYVTADGKTLYAKDDNGFAMKDQWPYQPTATQVAGHKVFDKPEEFDQSNWVVLNLKEEITTSQLESLIGSKIKVTGILRDRLNPEIDVDDMNVISEGQAYTPNLYTISSFGEGNDYFAMPPKPQEYVKIHWAIYQDGNFYMPKSENGINTQQLHGAVKSVLDMYEGGAFENGNMYELTGIVKALKPRVAAGGNTVYGVNVQDSEVSTYYELYPITSSKTDTDPVTSINRIDNDNEDNTYYNLLGQPVTNPAPGIYIKNGKRIIVR